MELHFLIRHPVLWQEQNRGERRRCGPSPWGAPDPLRKVMLTSYNYGRLIWTAVLEKTLESPLDCKEIQPVHSKGVHPGCSLDGMMLKLKLQYFGHLIRRVDSWKRVWCWEGLGAGGEGDDRGWDGWMASPTWWMWVWVNSGSWWWTRRPGMLQFMGSWRVGHDWATELNWMKDWRR